MVSPLTVDITARHSNVLQSSPYSLLMLIPRDTGVVAPANVITDIPTDVVATAQLGATTVARRWYNYLESQANVHVGVIPYVPAVALVDAETNAVAALDAVTAAAELAKISGPPDIILAPDLPGRATAASTVVARLETLCVDQRIEAIAVVDAYHLLGSLQTDVLTWATNNLGADIFAMTNNAAVGGVTEWGSVIAAGHLAKYAASQGVGSHPFSLRHPVTGVGTLAPVREFSLSDGSAAAEALADAFLSSLILHDGSDYIWGGKLNVAVPGDPRVYLGNAVIAKRMIKRGREALAHFLGVRATGLRLEEMTLVVQTVLDDEFGALVAGISVPTATLVGTQAVVRPDVGFYGFIESIRLAIEIEVAI